MERIERNVEALVHSVMNDVSNIYEGLNSLQPLLHYLQKPSMEPLLVEKSSMVEEDFTIIKIVRFIHNFSVVCIAVARN